MQLNEDKEKKNRMCRMVCFTHFSLIFIIINCKVSFNWLHSVVKNMVCRFMCTYMCSVQHWEKYFISMSMDLDDMSIIWIIFSN